MTKMQSIAQLCQRSFGRDGLRTYWFRLGIQLFFLFLVLLIAYEFALFVNAATARPSQVIAALKGGADPSSLGHLMTLPKRPAGVEGFLPIGGFIGLVDWIFRGRINCIHPAATILFTAFLMMALLLRKAFCSWICPIGLLSEGLARLGRYIIGRNLRVWRPLDHILRTIKYLLLAFFLQAILIQMGPSSLVHFIYGTYYKVSDVKMYFFFVNISTLAALIITGLALLSITFNGFWCRYLCPYGAILGLFSWFSPTRIHRSPATCNGCGNCERVCMAQIRISAQENVNSPECTGCLDCLASCPAPDCLTNRFGKYPFPLAALAGAIVLLFLLWYGGALLMGVWENQISDQEYLKLVDQSHRLKHP